MTRILIPSDFTVDSLYFVSQSIEAPTAEEVDVVLVYGIRSSTSASELIGIALEDQLNQLQSEDLLKPYERIYKRFKNRKLTIYADIIRTDNVTYLKHYIQGTRIIEIKISDGYNYCNKKRNCFDVGKSLKKVKTALIHPIATV